MAVVECATYSRRASLPKALSLIDALEVRGRVRVLAPGQVLFRQGDEASGLHLVLSGLVGFRQLDAAGEGALFDVRAAGEVVGHEAVLGRGPHASTAEALTLCRVSYVDRSQVSQMLSASPSLRDELVARALADGDRMRAKCVSLLTEGLRTRFIKLLLALHEQQGGGGAANALVVDLPLQRKDVAELIGAAPESLSRLLAKLEAEKAIRVDGRKIHIANAAAILDGAAVPAAEPAAHDALAILVTARRALLAMIEAPDAATRTALNAEVQRASADLDALISEMCRANHRATASFTTVWRQFKATRQERIIPAVFAGKLDEAKRIATGVQAKRFDKMRALLAGPVQGEIGSLRSAS